MRFLTSHRLHWTTACPLQCIHRIVHRNRCYHFAIMLLRESVSVTWEMAASDLSRTALQHLIDAFALKQSGSLTFGKAFKILEFRFNDSDKLDNWAESGLLAACKPGGILAYEGSFNLAFCSFQVNSVSLYFSFLELAQNVSCSYVLMIILTHLYYNTHCDHDHLYDLYFPNKLLVLIELIVQKVYFGGLE